MLDGLDRDFLPGQPRRELNASQVVDRGRHLEVTDVGTAKSDAEVDARRLQRQGDFIAGVKTDSDTRDRTA